MPIPPGRRRPPAGSSPRPLEAAVRAVQIAYPPIYLRRLQALGCVTRTAAAADRRAAEPRLTATGAEGLRATSVLEAARVRALLRALTPDERTRAVEGLALLAAARALGDRAVGPRAAR